MHKNFYNYISYFIIAYVHLNFNLLKDKLFYSYFTDTNTH